jgi:hypothetical protein
MLGPLEVDEAHMSVIAEPPPVLSYRRPQRCRLERGVHVFTPASMALHFAKGGAVACFFPLVALSCVVLVQEPGWGILFAGAGIIAAGAVTVGGALCFFAAAAVRLLLTGHRVRLLFVPRSLITWTGVTNPLIVMAIIATSAKMLGSQPDWRIIIPAMCLPGAIIGASLPRSIRRR